MVVSEAVNWVSIILFGCAVMNYVVIRPLQSAINRLDASVEGLKNTVESSEEKRNNETRLFDSRLVLVEASIKLAHRRIDKLVRGAE